MAGTKRLDILSRAVMGAVGILGIMPSSGYATVYYQLTRLGTLGTNTADNHSAAFAINDSGVVVGSCGSTGGSGSDMGYDTPGGSAFIWTPTGVNSPDGTMTELASLSQQVYATPVSINNAGDISGQAQSQNYLGGVIWTGTSHVPATLLDSAPSTYKTFIINNHGMVAGWSHTNSGYHAAVWTDRETPVELNAGPYSTDLPKGVNDSGQVAGLAYPSPRAVVYNSVTNTPTYLGTLLGDDTSFATAINQQGSAVGVSGNYHGFLWTPNTTNGTMGAMSAIPIGSPVAINDSGTVIGTNYAVGPSRWTAAQGLRDLAGDIGDEQAGFDLRNVFGMNNPGQIVGEGYDTTAVAPDTTHRAFLLTPLPVPQVAVGHWKSYGGGGSGPWARVNTFDATGGVHTFTAATPRDPGDTAIFGDLPDSYGGTVYLQDNISVGHVVFQAAGPAGGYDIAGTAGQVLTIDNNVAWATGVESIGTVNGAHTISAALALPAGAHIDTAAGTQLTLVGNVSGSGTIIKTGDGTLRLARINPSNLAVPNVSVGIAVTAGELIVPVAHQFAVPTDFAALALPSLTIDSGATATIDPNGPASGFGGSAITLLELGALDFNTPPGQPRGTLQLRNNDAIIHHGNLAQIMAALTDGYHAGAWDGHGVISADAASDPTGRTSLGAILNSQDGQVIRSQFDGVAVDGADVLVKYTYLGDANLDGLVDGADYTHIDAGYGSGGAKTGWLNGDFNYDGNVDGTDYSLIDGSFGANLSALPSGVVAVASTVLATAAADIASPVAVPEPGLVACSMALLTAGLLRRTRRARIVT